MRITRVVLLLSLLALVVVPTALALRFTDESFSPPVGETGKSYPNWSFTGAGGCGPALPYQYRLLGSSPPPGLTIDTSGLVHGIPTQTGDFSFWLELSDEDPPSADWCDVKKAQRQFTIKIVPGLNILQQSLNPKAAFVNQPYSFQLSAEGGGTQTWSLLSGNLPAGIALSSSGLLSGTPTATGDFTFKIQVKDTGTRSDAETYTLAVVEPLRIATPLPAAEAGLPFTVDLEATGGRPGHTWSVEGALPAGLALDPATGVISGTPRAAGSYPLKVTVTDALGLKTTQDVTLKVAARLMLVKRALRAAKLGVTYNALVLRIGGVGPFKWIVNGVSKKRVSTGHNVKAKRAAGRLPLGIKLNPKTGRLSGVPRQAGTFRFSLRVTDKLGAVSTRTYLLKVLG
jgi:hypothetical protein